MRTVRSAIPLAAVAVVLASAGCGTATLTFVPRTPAMRLSVTTGCPQSLGQFKDVINTGAGVGTELIPPAPEEGLVCRYREMTTTGTSRSLSLYRDVNLSLDAARELEGALALVSTALPAGDFSCPPDTGSASILAFAYPGREDVDLWYADSSCQTLDNGKIGAFAPGNLPFSQDFERMINELAPPES